MRKKLFKIRLPVIYALTLVAGILFAVLAEYFKFSLIWLFLPVALTLCLCVILGVKKKKVYSVAVPFFVAVVFAVGALYAGLLISDYGTEQVFIDGAVTVCGTVKETGLTSKGTRYIILDGVSFGDTKVNGRLVAYFLDNAGEYCRRGYKVSFYSQPELLSFFSQGKVDYNAARGVKYSCVIAGSLQAKYGFSPFGEIAYAVERLLYSNADRETASVALALLTGNADMLSSGTISAFRGGGIAHVFAVSGLHVGVIYAAMSAVMKKIPINRFISSAIRIFIIFLFAGVCSFTSSSVRAAVMCSVMAVASGVRRRYDALNGVSVAAIIILLINPLSLFEVGFALSFGAVLGIFLLFHNFYSALFFLPRRVRNAIASGWSAQFSTIPVLTSSFGYISWAGIFLNLIFIPAISALFVVLFTATVICLILPFTAPILLPITTVPLQFIINIIVSSGLENAVIYGNFGGWIYLPFIAVVFALSDKFNLTAKVRCIVVGLTLLMVTCFAVVPGYGKGSNVSFSAGTEGGYAVVNNAHGTVLIVTQDVEGVPSYVTQNADALVVVGDDEGLNALINLDGDFDQVYLRSSSPYLPPLDNYAVTYADSFSVCGMQFNFSGNALLVNADGVNFAFAYGEKGESYGNLPQNCSLCLYDYATYDPILFTQDGSYNLSYCGTMQYNASCGKLISRNAVPKE